MYSLCECACVFVYLVCVPVLCIQYVYLCFVCEPLLRLYICPLCVYVCACALCERRRKRWEIHIFFLIYRRHKLNILDATSAKSGTNIKDTLSAIFSIKVYICGEKKKQKKMSADESLSIQHSCYGSNKSRTRPKSCPHEKITCFNCPF